MCRCIYMCIFFCSECYMHFTGVVGLVHGRVCMLHKCVLKPTYTSATHSLQVVHICVYVYKCVYACICIWMRMCVYDIAWHVEVLLLGFSICTYVCICMRMYMCVHVCVYRCMCICMYMYICMSVYMYAYIYIRARVGVHMHSCRHILFICTVQSLYYMCVYNRCFLTLACVCVGGLVGLFQLVHG